MSPQEILAMNMAPMQKALADYAQSGVDLAKYQLQQADKDQAEADAQRRAIELLGIRQKGEKEINDANNKAALDRVNAQVQGYIDRMTAAEKSKFKDYFRNIGLIQSPGESDEDFIKRGNMAVAGQANALWRSIQTNQQHVTDLVSKEQQRLNGLAYSRAKALLAQDLASVDKRKAALLNSAPVEEVLKTLKPDQRATMEASWNTYLQQAQEAAMKEFDPTVMTRVSQLKQVIDNLSKAHSRVVDNPNAAGATPYLDFSMPDVQKKEDDFLTAATKAAGASPATPKTAGPGAVVVNVPPGPAPSFHDVLSLSGGFGTNKNSVAAPVIISAPKPVARPAVDTAALMNYWQGVPVTNPPAVLTTQPQAQPFKLLSADPNAVLSLQ